jgi:hypothetical protein
MIPWQIQIALNCLLFLVIGASVGFIFRRHLARTVVWVTLLSLFIPVAIDYAKAGFPLRATLLQELGGGMMFAAGPLLLFVWLPALSGALLVVLGCRLISTRRKRGWSHAGQGRSS